MTYDPGTKLLKGNETLKARPFILKKSRNHSFSTAHYKRHRKQAKKERNAMMDCPRSIPSFEADHLSVGDDLSIDIDLDDLQLEISNEHWNVGPTTTYCKAFNPRGIYDESQHDASMSSLSCSYATLGASLSSLCSTRWESEHSKSSGPPGPRRVPRSRSGSIRRVKSFGESSQSSTKEAKVGSELEHGMDPCRSMVNNMPNRRVFRNTSLNEKLLFEATCQSSCATFASYASLLSTRWEAVAESSERSVTEVDLSESVVSFESDWRDEAKDLSLSSNTSILHARLKRHNSASDALRSSFSSVHIQADEGKVKSDERSLFNRGSSLMMPPRFPLTSRTTEAS